MRTLDEVIKAWSICFSDNSRSNCTGCPYADEDGESACFNHDREDALHYLKHLQEYYEMSREHHEPNPALTWDELKQIEGKPVWVEHKLFKGWRLVGWQANDHMMNLVGSYSEQLPLFEDDCGKTWNAYRKERE